MNNLYRFILLSLIAMSSAFAQTVNTQPAPSKEIETKEEVVIDKIRVFQNGKIELNGKETSLQDLKTELIQLKEQNGEVWYYSESSKGYPSNQAMKVLRLILDNKIPYKLSIQPDFSDYARVKSKKDVIEKEEKSEEKSGGLIK